MKLIVAERLWPTSARIAAREHNVECHGGQPTANIEVDPSYGKPGPPKYRVYCEQCAELADDEETKGDDSG